MNTDKPYPECDYERAKRQGLNLDDWDDYIKYYELGENNEN